MSSIAQIGVLGLTLGLLGVSGAAGQQRGRPDTVATWHQEAWTEIVTRNGLKISYLHYPEADTEHSGIVLMLENKGHSALRYSFTVIFRGPEADTTSTVDGIIRPGQLKTGSSQGLFWVPFERQGHRVVEIGLRGLEVTPVRTPRTGSRDAVSEEEGR